MSTRTFVFLALILGYTTATSDGATQAPVKVAKYVPQENRDLAVSGGCSPDCLPANYNGPIFVSDIDDTLRPFTLAGLVLQDTVPGAQALLNSIASRKVPIVYLTAGIIVILPLNVAFLNGLPKGTLINSLSWDPNRSPQEQAAYKEGVLANLKSAYPNVTLYCLGDNKYGDPTAYTVQNCTGTYILNVNSGAVYPAGFTGYVFSSYDSTTSSKITGDLDQALAMHAAPSGNLWTNIPSQAGQVFIRGTSASTGSSGGGGSGAPMVYPCLYLFFLSFILCTYVA